MKGKGGTPRYRRRREWARNDNSEERKKRSAKSPHMCVYIREYQHTNVCIVVGGEGGSRWQGGEWVNG